MSITEFDLRVLELLVGPGIDQKDKDILKPSIDGYRRMETYYKYTVEKLLSVQAEANFSILLNTNHLLSQENIDVLEYNYNIIKDLELNIDKDWRNNDDIEFVGMTVWDKLKYIGPYKKGLDYISIMLYYGAGPATNRKMLKYSAKQCERWLKIDSGFLSQELERIGKKYQIRRLINSVGIDNYVEKMSRYERLHPFARANINSLFSSLIEQAEANPELEHLLRTDPENPKIYDMFDEQRSGSAPDKYNHSWATFQWTINHVKHVYTHGWSSFLKSILEY